MADLVLVYGMRLLPADEVLQVGDAAIQLKSGREARCTMHVLEGSKEDIEKQLKMSVEAFFELHYPEG
jgi:phosphoglycolate phosphatase-like HAD superfamily hydrolase